MHTLEASILAEFPVGAEPPRDLVSHQCPECDALAAELAGTRWESLTRRFIERHYGSLPLLTPQAFAYYLPAFLVYALRGAREAETVKEFVLYGLTPEARPSGDDDWSRERLKPFTEAQHRVLLGFLAWLRTDTEFICDIEDVDARVARFNQLWASRWDA